MASRVDDVDLSKHPATENELGSPRIKCLVSNCTTVHIMKGIPWNEP